MRYRLKEIVDLAEKGGFAVPAFNVYNLETLMGGGSRRRGNRCSGHFSDVQPLV